MGYFLNTLNGRSRYVIKTVFADGKRTTNVVERLVSYDSLLETLDRQDPIEWGKPYLKELNEQEQKGKEDILVRFSPAKIRKTHPNDYKRFIKKTACTADREVAANELFRIGTDAIAAEERYDGFYGVCTNLEDGAGRSRNASES